MPSSRPSESEQRSASQPPVPNAVRLGPPRSTRPPPGGIDGAMGAGASQQASDDSTPCVFCSVLLLAENRRKRCKQQGRVSEFVSRFCRPAGFLYPRLVAMKGDARVPLCIPCVNWQRRCTLGQRKRCQGQRPYLLLDHFALFMLEPGEVAVPDQRCTVRMVLALLRAGPGGPAVVLLPVQVQAMMAILRGRLGESRQQLTGENMLTELLATWWQFNERTVFFAHNLTAKLVRKMVKECGEAGAA
jgi:hypothetical protein